ncbi:hypothetical protein SAMN05421755_100715 [Nitrosomonas sp. Nm33]|nr:hypothetical protein SAMN05421755_100715 [Nitrosomonas sp. Nm33]
MLLLNQVDTHYLDCKTSMIINTVVSITGSEGYAASQFSKDTPMELHHKLSVQVSELPQVFRRLGNLSQKKEEF